MEGGGKRYIVTREPIGTANKHFQDLSKQLSGIESMLQIMQNIIQSLAQKSNSVELKLQNIVEDSAKTSKYFSDIDNKFQTLNIKIEKRERQLKKPKKKPAGMEKHAQTEYNLFIKPVESLLQPLQSTKATSTEELIINEESSPKSDGKIEKKIDSDDMVSNNDEFVDNPDEIPAVIVNTSNKKESSSSSITDSSLLVTLNKENDFPDGCWLGDPQDSNRRVRVALSQDELVLLTKTFTTPEKLALALVDKLFTRETLAVSNLTGKGRHNKKRLDPLLIYGIYSQLRYLHNITDSDWSRIKNNIEAKCRFLWRRKMRSKYPELHQHKSSNSHQSDQLTGKQVQQHQPLMGWGNEVLIAGRGSEETGNIVLYPLYQVDSNQLVQVAGLQNGEIVEEKSGELVATEASLSQPDHRVATEIDSMETTTQEQVVNVELGGRASSSKQLIQQKTIDQDHTEINHQTLTLSGGDLIINDLGEVISITSEADVDCLMTVSSVDYL